MPSRFFPPGILIDLVNRPPKDNNYVGFKTIPIFSRSNSIFMRLNRTHCSLNDCIDHSQKNTVCKSFSWATILQHLVVNSSLFATGWGSLGWCDVHDCIAHLLTCLFHEMRSIFCLYVLYVRGGQINPSWVSESHCNCMYVNANYK